MSRTTLGVFAFMPPTLFQVPPLQKTEPNKGKTGPTRSDAKSTPTPTVNPTFGQTTKNQASNNDAPIDWVSTIIKFIFGESVDDSSKHWRH
jgi:hypothetical protein